MRDLKTWYESCVSTIFRVMLLDPAMAPPHMQHIVRLTQKLIKRNTFDDRLEDAAHCMAVHQAHIDEVKRTIPAERLLVFQVKEGWEPRITSYNVCYTKLLRKV